MPAKSEKQQRAMGMALSIKRGKTSRSRAKGTVKKLLKMSQGDLEDFARKPKKARKKR
jgi:hypothetical protein